MYITYQSNEFCIATDAYDQSVCELLPPVCIENGMETEVPFDEEKDGHAIY